MPQTGQNGHRPQVRAEGAVPHDLQHGANAFGLAVSEAATLVVGR